MAREYRTDSSVLLTVSAVAQLLGMTNQAVRNALSRGQEGLTIPPSFKLGTRRVWHRRHVLRWLDQQMRKSRKERKTMDIPRITVGLELVDDDGDEVVVQKINARKDTVTLAGDDGSYEMSLRDLRKALLEGEFAQVVEGAGELTSTDDDEEDEAEAEGGDDDAEDEAGD